MGTVYACGANYAGQVGNGTTKLETTPIVVAAGATQISATANNVLINLPSAGAKTDSAAGLSRGSLSAR